MTPGRGHGGRENAERKIGQCSARGPYRESCTDYAGHSYAHYDAREDRSWTDRSDDHRDGCECDVCSPRQRGDEEMGAGAHPYADHPDYRVEWRP